MRNPLQVLSHSIALFVAISVSSVAYSAEAYDPSDDLISAFGSQCSSSGDLSNAAMAQSGVLKGVIASIRDDEACKSLIPLANSIDTDLSSTLQTHSDVDRLTATVDDLQAAIETEKRKGADADSTYIALLQSERESRQVDLLKAKQEVNRSPKVKRQEAVKNFYNHSTAFLDGLAANSACVSKHPNILAQAGAQILKLSADYVSGLGGAIALATGGIIDRFVQFTRQYAINRDLRDVMMARMSHALGCTFEGLSATYCRARDTQLLVDANKNIQDPDACSTIAQGTNLLARDLSSFSDFVSTIYAGSKASSMATAGEKQQVISLRASLENLRVSLDGLTSTQEKNYNSTTDSEKQQNTIRTLIRGLATSISSNMNGTRSCGPGCMSNSTGAIGDAFSEDADCGVLVFYYSRGKLKSCQRNANETGASNGCELCIARTHPEYGLPSLSEIKETSKAVMGIGLEYVSQQSALYNQNNPQLALTASETYGRNRKRAMDFLYDARTYLQHLMDEQDGMAKGNIGKTVTKSLERINKIIEKLENSASDPNAKPDEVTKDLAELLAPSSDTYYIPLELSTIIKHDIDLKLASGKIDKNLALVLQLSTSDSVSQLLNSYGSLEALRNQIRTARKLTKTNLDAVGIVFNGNIQDILKSLQESAKSDPDSRDDLSLFCVQTLLIPSAPKIDGEDVSRYCNGAKYKSVYKGVADLDFNALAQKSYDERACSVYDFYRKARLSEIGVKNSSAK
jgi:hypothetical protein